MFTENTVLYPNNKNNYTYFKSSKCDVYIMQFYTKTKFGEKICKALDNNEILRKLTIIFDIWRRRNCIILNYFYNIYKNELMIETQVNNNTFKIINKYNIVKFIAKYEEPYMSDNFFRMNLSLYLRNS